MSSGAVPYQYLSIDTIGLLSHRTLPLKAKNTTTFYKKKHLLFLLVAFFVLQSLTVKSNHEARQFYYLCFPSIYVQLYKRGLCVQLRQSYGVRIDWI